MCYAYTLTSVPLLSGFSPCPCRWCCSCPALFSAAAAAVVPLDSFGLDSFAVVLAGLPFVAVFCDRDVSWAFCRLRLRQMCLANSVDSHGFSFLPTAR
jgi:hypothetical protein